jgi:hypothetical protein
LGHVACCCPRRDHSSVVVADRGRNVVRHGTPALVDTQAVPSDPRRRGRCLEKGHGLRVFLSADDLPRCRVVSRVAQVERNVGERREREDSFASLYLRRETRTGFRLCDRQPMAITQWRPDSWLFGFERGVESARITKYVVTGEPYVACSTTRRLVGAYVYPYQIIDSSR